MNEDFNSAQADLGLHHSAMTPCEVEPENYSAKADAVDLPSSVTQSPGVDGEKSAKAGRLALDGPNPTAKALTAENPERGEIDHYLRGVPKVGVDLRFSDPLIGEIVQLHRMRRRWIKARNSLVLQCKAFGRSLHDGDKAAGSAAFDRVKAGSKEEADELLTMALLPFIPAIQRFDAEIHPIELRLAKLAKRLPVAGWASEVRGFGFASLAAIVGEAGDISQYHSVSAVWKRMGLAVIDGDGRQRKVADAGKALLHGYSPERRSVVWNMAEPLAKHQRTWLNKETGEIKKEPGPYGIILEAEKAKALVAGCSKLHAENRAKRHMSKAFLRDLYLAWRAS